MKKIPQVFFFFATLFLFQGCVGFQVFNTTQVPNLTHKGEGSASEFVAFDHVQAQTAYSPVNHLALLGNVYDSPITVFGVENSEGTTMTEGAIGYYTTLLKDTVNKGGLYVDAYLGFGKGQRQYKGETYWAQSPDGLDNCTIASAYDKGMVQSSVYWKEEHFELGLTLQGAQFYYTSFDYALLEYGGHFANYDQLHFQNKSFFNLNTALTAKFQTRFAGLILQVARNSPFISSLPLYTNTSYPRPNFNSRVVELNIGLQINICRLFTPKEKRLPPY
jgi:hypothetical protein